MFHNEISSNSLENSFPHGWLNYSAFTHVPKDQHQFLSSVFYWLLCLKSDFLPLEVTRAFALFQIFPSGPCVCRTDSWFPKQSTANNSGSPCMLLFPHWVLDYFKMNTDCLVEIKIEKVRPVTEKVNQELKRPLSSC